jgi:hypothetical protein
MLGPEPVDLVEDGVVEQRGAENGLFRIEGAPRAILCRAIKSPYILILHMILTG